MEVKFGLDFDPADDFDGSDLEGSYTIFGSFSEAFPLVETQTGIDYGQEGIFQDSQNFGFGFWSDLAQALTWTLTRTLWVCTTLVCTCTRWKALC